MPRTGCNHLVLARLAAASLAVVALLSAASCSGDRAAAKQAIEEHLKNQGIVDMKLEALFTDSRFPGKAYAAVVVTFNFATSDGTPQKGHMGYILQREGKGWKVEENTKYTTEEDKAKMVLSGQKI